MEPSTQPEKKSKGLFAKMKVKGTKNTPVEKQQKLPPQSETSLSTSTYEQKSEIKTPVMTEQTKSQNPYSQQDSHELKKQSEVASQKSSLKNEPKLQPKISSSSSITESISSASQVRKGQKVQVKEEKIKKQSIQLKVEKTKPKKKYSDSIKQEVPLDKRKKSSTVSSNRRDSSASVKKDSSAKEEVFAQINQRHQKILDIYGRQFQERENIQKLLKNITKTKEKLQTQTQKQYVSVANQQYDKAEQHQIKIGELTVVLENQETLYQAEQGKLEKYQNEELSILKSDFQESKRLIRKIKLVELQLQDEIGTIKSNGALKIQNNKSLAEKQTRKIQTLESDIAHQKEQLEEYQKNYMEDLDAKRVPLKQQKQSKIVKRNELQKEIAELQKKLKNKKAQLKETNSRISALGEQITEIQQNFKEEGKRLEERKERVGDMQEEKENYITQLKKIEVKIEQEANLIESKVNEITVEIKQLKQSSQLLDNKKQTYDDTIESRQTKLKTYLHSVNMLKEFEANSKSAKAVMKDLQFKKTNITAQVVKLDQARETIKAKIPKLQDQQKQLVAAKNFKVAGMKKNEIKETKEQLEQLKLKIQKLYEEEGSIQAEIEESNQKMEELINEEKQLTKNKDLSYHCILIEQLEILKEQGLFWENKSDKISKANLKNIKCYNKSLEKDLNILEEKYTQLKETKKIQKQVEEQRGSIQHEKQQQQSDEMLSEEQQKQKSNSIIEEEKSEKQINSNEQQQEPQQEIKVDYKPPMISDNSSTQQADEKKAEKANKYKEEESQEQPESGYVPLKI